MQDWIFKLGLPRDLVCVHVLVVPSKNYWSNQEGRQNFFLLVSSGLNHKTDNSELLNQISNMDFKFWVVWAVREVFTVKIGDTKLFGHPKIVP